MRRMPGRLLIPGFFIVEQLGTRYYGLYDIRKLGSIRSK
jgi:hypothetical protein